MADSFNRVLWPVFTVLCAYLLYRSWRLGRHRTELVTWSLACVGGAGLSLASYGILAIAGLVGKVVLIVWGVVLILFGWPEGKRPSDE